MFLIFVIQQATWVVELFVFIIQFFWSLYWDFRFSSMEAEYHIIWPWRICDKIFLNI